MIKLTDIIQEIDSNKKYYIELIPVEDLKKYQQVEKTINKLKDLEVNINDINVDKIYGDKVRRYFIGTYKDGSSIPAQYKTKNDLFNHPMGDIKVTLFTKEEAEKQKNKIDNYVKEFVANIKMI